MEGSHQDKDGQGADQQRQRPFAGIPDLAYSMQDMSLAEPGLCCVQNNQVMQQEQLDFSFCLLMKVACTAGTPRNITQEAVEEAMSRAWGSIFYGISQVSNSVFMAHFRSHEEMVSIYMRQPWAMNTDTLLLEWFDANDNANSSSDYRFDIFVTVRAYGIPRDRRSISLLTDILNQVGEISEFHILKNNNLFAKHDYIWGRAKMKVNYPVKDRAIVTYADNSTAMAYLHYEKIRRICLFCGIMFHTAETCNYRANLIAERSKNRQAALDVPAQRFGKWVNDDKFIPVEVIQSTRISTPGNNLAGNAILARLQKLFVEDPKGKGKLTEEQTGERFFSTQGQFHPVRPTADSSLQIAQPPLQYARPVLRNADVPPAMHSPMSTKIARQPLLPNPHSSPPIPVLKSPNLTNRPQAAAKIRAGSRDIADAFG